MSSRTSIGGMLLESVEGWSFSVRDGAVAGRRRREPGLLRIMSVAPNLLPQPLSHERCFELIEERVGAAEGTVSDRRMMQSVTGPFGSARYRRGKDVICVWYCNRPAGLIIGAYACPADLAKTPEYNLARAQCARMIATAVFDRPSWGGEDELTKCLIDQLEKEGPELADQAPQQQLTKVPDAASRPARGAGKRGRRA